MVTSACVCFPSHIGISLLRVNFVHFVAENMMSPRGMRGLIYSIAFFSCISLFLRYYPARPASDPEVLYRVMGKPLEKVNVDYTRNIHFSVKTSVKNYRTRLSLLLLTWFQTVEKDQVWYGMCLLVV